MNRKRLVAYDYSGSTEACDFYHNTVQKILTQYEPYDVILWDNQLKISSTRELKNINRIRDGRGGTRPILVAQYCSNQKITGDMILITDGQIFKHHVEELDKYISANPLHLSHIECYLIQTAESDKLDATVIAPFLRNVSHIVFMFPLNSQEPIVVSSGGGSIEEFLQEIRQINTIAEFQSKFDHLFSEVVTKMLGKGEDLQIRDEILALQRRLISQMKVLPPSYNIELIKREFAEGNLTEMTRIAKSLHEAYFRNWNEPSWLPQIFHLFRMCTGNLGSIYSLSALGSKFNADRVRRADVVKNFELHDIDVLDASLTTFVCPISYEEEADMILLVRKPDQGLLAGEDKDTLNTIITNPLSAVKYQSFCRKFLNHLDNPISLRVMKDAEALGHPLIVSPTTRLPIIGGFCLSPSENHCKATNSVVAQLMAEGKQVGNFDLWFMLIWWLIEKGDIPRLSVILPQVREHLVFRLRRHLGTFTLTNIPYFPITLIPMGVACWCTLSAIAYKVPENLALKYLKCHGDHINALLRAVELLEYPVPQQAIDFIYRVQAYGAIIKIIREKNTEAISWAIRLAHSFVKIDPAKIRNNKFKYVTSTIPIDGPRVPQEQVEEALSHLPEPFSKLNENQRRAAVKILEQFDAGLDRFLQLTNEVPLVNWQYGLNNYDLPFVPCTLR